MRPIQFARALAGVTLAASAVLPACSKGAAPRTVRGPAAEDMPARVDVASGKLTSGFSRGVLRRSYAVPAFAITRYPVTVGQYRACVDASACSVPELASRACRQSDARAPLGRATYGAEGASDWPLTCATVDQAKQYCEWIGAGLPDAQQWMLAARGSDVVRFAWGATAATCEQHPEAEDCAAREYAVGKHAKSASPNAVEDVLLTRGELVIASPESDFTSCAPPRAGCVFYGADPGAIDSVEPVFDGDPRQNEPVSAAGFRCAWQEGSQ